MNADSYQKIWEAYSSSWSEPSDEIRKETLQHLLISDCSYTDPAVDLSGIDRLSDYMAEFQRTFPGVKFVLTDFNVHHDQSFALCNMVDESEKVVGSGGSFGMYKNDKLIKMVGFY